MPGSELLTSPAAFHAWLDALVAAGSERGAPALGITRALLDRLDRPQNDALTVHIVGTAGKGSVAGLVTGGCVAAGLRTITHQSPHVDDIRERFLIDGRLGGWDEVLNAANTVAAAAAEVENTEARPPTFFAVTAAIAWELGRSRRVEIAVIEAGIGGRFDATNMMSRSDVLTVITAIGLDHTDVLGTTVAEVAEEKSAVLEGRTDAVLAPQPSPEAEAVIVSAAASAGCRLHRVDAEASDDWRLVARATAACVTAVLGARLGRIIPSGPATFPPGRYEVVETQDRRLVLDGAHNPMKLGALAAVVATDGQPQCVIAALGEGKDLDGSVAALAGLAPIVIATQFGPDKAAVFGPRSRPAAVLAAALRRCGIEAQVSLSVEDAVRQARAVTGAGDTVLVTGSFLHLAEVRRRFTTEI